jgi:hypothetical protein
VYAYRQSRKLFVCHVLSSMSLLLGQVVTLLKLLRIEPPCKGVHEFVRSLSLTSVAIFGSSGVGSFFFVHECNQNWCASPMNREEEEEEEGERRKEKGGRRRRKEEGERRKEKGELWPAYFRGKVSGGGLRPAYFRGKFSRGALASILSWKILGESFDQHTFAENSRGELWPAYFRGKFSGRALANILSW